MNDKIVLFPDSSQIALAHGVVPPSAQALARAISSLPLPGASDCLAACLPLPDSPARPQLSLNRLSRNEARYRTLIASSSNIIWVTNPDGSFPEDCPSWRDFTGLTQAQGQGFGWVDSLHPGDRERVLNELRRAASAQTNYDTELRLRRHDGEYRHFCVHGVTVTYSDGALPEWVGTCTDITERKKAENALRESEEKFRQMVENINDVFWVCSNNFQQVLYVSPAYDSIWGQSAEGLYSNPHQWFEAILPEDRERVRTEFAPVFNNESSVSIEYRIRRPDGQIRWIQDRGFQVRDSAGNLIRIAGVATDITACKNTRLALQKSEERFRRYFDLGLIGLAISSPDKSILDGNEELCRLLGYSRDELRQKSWLDLTHPDDRTSSVATLAKMMNSEMDGYTLEKRYVRKNGEVVHATAAVKCARNPDNTVDYFVTLIQDVTAQKQAEARLRDAQAELVQASRRAGMAEVATSVLHNVGNVLNSLNITSSCLADGVSNSKTTSLARLASLLQEHANDLGGFFTNDPRGRQIPAYVNMLAVHLAREQADSLKQLDQLKKNIEHIAAIVSRQQTFAKAPNLSESVNLHDLIEDALSMNASAFVRNDVEVIRDLQSFPSITLQKHNLLQILVNLLRNAKDACAASHSVGKQITVRAWHDDRQVRIRVSDNGIGISPENLTRIFNHGFTTKPHGHGFGLHGSAIAAKDMGGTLTVESAGRGCGAAFTICLPLQFDGHHPVGAPEAP